MRFFERETVIGTPQTTAEFKAPIGNQQSYQIKVADGPVKHAWYYPLDNLTNLAFFDHIDVKASNVDPHAVELAIGANHSAMLRIRIVGTVVD